MKFTDEEKEEIKIFTFKYWREILIVLCLTGGLFSYYQWNETKKDLVEAVRISTTGRTTNEINSGLDAMKNREKNVYPEMDKKIDSLNSNIKALNDEIKKLQQNKPTKEKAYATFKNSNIQDLSKWFTDSGFTNTIDPSTSK